MPTSLSEILTPLRRRPLCCLALLWAVGIVLAVRLAVPATAWCIATVLFLLAWVATIPRSRSISACALGLAALCLSAGFSGWRLAPPQPQDARYLPGGGVAVRGYLLTAPISSSYGRRATFRVTERRREARWERARVDVYLTGSGDFPTLGAYCEILGTVAATDAPGNPFDFNRRSYLAERGLTYHVRVSASSPLPRAAPRPRLSAVRAYCSRALARSMPGNYSALHAQLLESLVLGVYGSPLPEQLTTQFQRAGTIHLMVVSGSQVALLGGICLLPLCWLPFGAARTSYPRLRRVLLLLSLPVLAGYVLLADRGPSVDRALLMLLLAALALLLALSPLARRRSYHPDGLTLLAAAGLVLLLNQPAMLFSPGMQLSFAAVFGLLTVTPVFLRLWQRLPQWFALTLAGTLGAQLLTYPVLAWHFGSISLLGLVTNLIAVPAVAILLPLGLLAMLCAVCLPGVATLLNTLALPFLHLLFYTSDLAARCPWGQFTCHIRSPWIVLAYLGVLALGMRLLWHWLHSRVQGWDVPAGREPRMW